MIHLLLPYAVAAALVGIGTYGVLAVGGDRWQAGNVLTLFIITIAAAEVVLALAVIVAVFRRRDNIDISITTALPASAPAAAETGDPR